MLPYMSLLSPTHPITPTFDGFLHRIEQMDEIRNLVDVQIVLVIAMLKQLYPSHFPCSSYHRLLGKYHLQSRCKSRGWGAWWFRRLIGKLSGILLLFWTQWVYYSPLSMFPRTQTSKSPQDGFRLLSRQCSYPLSSCKDRWWSLRQPSLPAHLGRV